MKKNLKHTILKSAVRSFMKDGYENTTMRSIANDLGLAVGNVNYYYPKKEDIVKDYHNAVMDAFLSEVLSESKNHDPWLTYFTAEYAFMNFIAHDDSTRTVYTSFTHVASLRDFYTQRHQELFLSLFENHLDISLDEIYLSTLAMCSLEFDIISHFPEHQSSWDFDDIMRHIFEVRLDFLHLPKEQYLPIIDAAMQRGKEYISIDASIHETIFEKNEPVEIADIMKQYQ